MSSLNRVTIIGNLGRDPEVRTTQAGDKVANLSVAVTERWKDKAGAKQERTEWLKCVAFGNLAGIIEQYLRKGSKVYLEGSLQTRKWQDKDGQDRYATEVVMSAFNGKLVMLDGKSNGAGAASEPREPGKAEIDLDDEVPF